MSTIISDMVSHLQCGEAIAANDAVYIKSADGKIYKYSPLDPTQVFAGIAKEAGLLNAFIRVVQSGRVKGFTGLTPGQFVYASVTTPGGFQLTDPGSTLKVALGIAKSSTELTVNGALGIKTGGGTGSGGINYILNPDADTTLGWSTYADAAGVSPVDGTGGSPTVTFTRSTSTPLRGTASFLYTKPASNVQGQGFSYDFTIDPADCGKVLQGYFDYQIASGTFADNDLSVWIYDITNARMIQPAPYLIKNSGIIERFPLEFQTAINSTSYRLIIHQASTSAVASTLKFDNFNVGPTSKNYGSVVLAPIPFLSTLTGLGNATQALSYQKIGNTVRITGTIIIGATLPTSTIIFSLPLGMSADYSSVPKGIDNTDSYQAVGYATSYPGAATGRVQRAANSLTDFIIGYNSGAVWNATTPATWSAGQSFTLDLVVPIQGWSSSQVMSSDADTRVVALRVSGTPVGTVGATSNGFYFPTIVNDTHGAYVNNANTGYLIKTSGYYYFDAQAVIGGSLTIGTDFAQIVISGGSTTIARLTYAANTTEITACASGITYCSAGQYITFNTTASKTLSFLSTLRNGMSIYKLSGPSQIMASESVSALYTGAPPTGTLNAARNTVTFGTKIKDSHNAYSGGAYTIPVSGTYDISAHITILGTYALNNNSQVAISIDGASASYLNAVHAAEALSELSPQINIKSLPLLAGQVIRIQAATTSTSPSYPSDSRVNFFSIVRTGNY